MDWFLHHISENIASKYSTSQVLHECFWWSDPPPHFLPEIMVTELEPKVGNIFSRKKTKGTVPKLPPYHGELLITM